jgi:hypothetical protein
MVRQEDVIHDLAVMITEVTYLPSVVVSPSLMVARLEIRQSLEAVPGPYAGSRLEDTEMRLRKLLELRQSGDRNGVRSQ